MIDRLFLLFIIMTSCTRNGLNLPNEFIKDMPDADFKEINQRSSIVEARTVAKNVSLTCSPGACPDGIAVIAAVGQTNHEDESQRYFQMEPCTGTFVKLKDGAPDDLYVVTAGHCVPRRLRTQGSSCAEDLTIKVIKGANITCESVAFISAPDSERFTSYYDVALLKVKADTAVSTYEISQKPLKDADKPYQVKMLAVDPLPNEESKVRLRETECWYLQNSYIVPNSMKTTDPFFVTRGCSLILGNSGAPLLDGGVVVGVQSNFVRYKEKTISDGKVTVASNLYCLDIAKKSLRCEASQPLIYADEADDYHVPSYLNLLRKKDPKTLDKETQKALSILTNGSKLFESYKDISGFSKSLQYFDFKGSNSAYIRLPFPNCYQAAGLPANSKDGIELLEKNVVVYGLQLATRTRIPENRFKLSLYYRIAQPEMQLKHRGSGNFRLESPIFPRGFVDIALNPCR